MPDSAQDIVIRRAAAADLDPLASMCAALWPDSSAEEHTRELALLLHGSSPSGMPHTFLVAEMPSGALAGFLEVGLRSHADGCDPAHAVGFVEGWFVEEPFRSQGIGRQLLAAAEDWARRYNCREMASDALLANLPSQRAHEALGFEIVDTCIHYRKVL